MRGWAVPAEAQHPNHYLASCFMVVRGRRLCARSPWGFCLAMLTSLKNRLLKAGPKSVVLRQAFRLQAAVHGFSMRVADGRISLLRGDRKMILGLRDVISVPFAIHEWDQFFDTLEGKVIDGRTVLDFSE